MQPVINAPEIATAREQQLFNGKNFHVFIYNKTESISGLHQHDYYEFTLVLTGRYFQEINGKRVLLERGDFVFIPLGSHHQSFYEFGATRILNVGISKRFFEQHYREEQVIDDIPQWLKSTVEKMHDKEQFSESALENMVTLSAKSQEYLTRATQRYYGKTPMQIINEIRINFAKKQLEMTNYSVTDIAFEAGYSSPSLFIKTFKKLTSFTPKSYRKKLTEFNQ